MNSKKQEPKKLRPSDLTPEDWKKINKRTLQMYELSMRARGILGQKKAKP